MHISTYFTSSREVLMCILPQLERRYTCCMRILSHLERRYVSYILPIERIYCMPILSHLGRGHVLNTCCMLIFTSYAHLISSRERTRVRYVLYAYFYLIQRRKKIDMCCMLILSHPEGKYVSDANLTLSKERYVLSPNYDVVLHTHTLCLGGIISDVTDLLLYLLTRP